MEDIIKMSASSPCEIGAPSRQ